MNLAPLLVIGIYLAVCAGLHRLDGKDKRVQEKPDKVHEYR